MIGTIVITDDGRGIVLNTKAGPGQTFLIAASNWIGWVHNPIKDKKQTFSLSPCEFIEPNKYLVERRDLPDWSYKTASNDNWSFIGYEEFCRKAWLRIDPMKRSRSWLSLASISFALAMVIQMATSDSLEPTAPAKVFGWVGIASVTKFGYDYYTFLQEFS